MRATLFLALTALSFSFTVPAATAQTYTAEETRERIRADRAMRDLLSEAETKGVKVEAGYSVKDVKIAIQEEANRQEEVSKITCSRIRIGQTYHSASYSLILAYGEQAFEVPLRSAPMRFDHDAVNGGTSILLMYDGAFVEFARLPVAKPSEIIALMDDC